MARVINNKYIFIHAAKTGGTFFREAINHFGIPNYEIGLKHAPLSAFPYTHLIPIMFIRYPIGWYISRWRYGMMTYFGEKIKYMPEAQQHWMCPVWDTDLWRFVEKTLAYYPDGVATKYFTDMIGDLKTMRPYIFRNEDLHRMTHRILSTLFERPDILPEQVSSLPRILESKKIHSDPLPVTLQKEIESRERVIIDLFYT